MIQKRNGRIYRTRIRWWQKLIWRSEKEGWKSSESATTLKSRQSSGIIIRRRSIFEIWRTSGEKLAMQFFIGIHRPSDAWPFLRSMISINRIRGRKSQFRVNKWIMDSGGIH